MAPGNSYLVPFTLEVTKGGVAQNNVIVTYNIRNPGNRTLPANLHNQQSTTGQQGTATKNFGISWLTSASTFVVDIMENAKVIGTFTIVVQ